MKRSGIRGQSKHREVDRVSPDCGLRPSSTSDPSVYFSERAVFPRIAAYGLHPGYVPNAAAPRSRVAS